MTITKKHIPLLIIIILHTVGLAGFILNPVYFRSLSHVNLIISTCMVLVMCQQKNWAFYLALLSTAIIGYFIEVIGVKTEMIFGTYWYGRALGIKILQVPLLIGINWAILIYCTSQFCKFKNIIINALIGACLMVGLDFFIEQQASKFDFWYWKNQHIPLQNYIAWFLISFFLNLLFQKQLSQKPNTTAKVFYIVQIVFFWYLILSV